MEGTRSTVAIHNTAPLALASSRPPEPELLLMVGTTKAKVAQPTCQQPLGAKSAHGLAAFLPDDRAMKLTLTPGLLVIIIATQISVAIHFGKPIVEETRKMARRKLERDNRWRSVLKLAQTHCTEEVLRRNRSEWKQVQSWEDPIPPAAFNKPKTKRECLDRLGMYADIDRAAIPLGLPWPPHEILY